MNEKKICAVVVTYNRKELLVKCLDAIVAQIYKPHSVYIVDNASTDGTLKFVQEKGFYNVKVSNIMFHYLLLPKNTGGAGGFYSGIKTAYDSKEVFEAIWVMDDDGIPDDNCLNHLQQWLNMYSYISPLVLSIENPQEMAFNTLPQKNIAQLKNNYPNGIIKNHANPFNGVLFRRDFIEKVGFPKKEMFIWGDENEYETRAASMGIYPITVMNALHLHPQDRMVSYKDFLGRFKIVYVESELRRYCKYRNSAYILSKYLGIPKLMYFFIRYTLFYIVSRKFDIKGLSLFYQASIAGIRNDFTGHNKYLKK